MTDLKRILYVSQEIAPYLPASKLATSTQHLPQQMLEAGIEVRTFMPKYGFVNERRNQLHEVIRLSGINITIDDTDHPLILKVATLQPARLQVYFVFNDDYFNKNIVKQLETASDPAQNDERCIFFAHSVLETVKKLRWVPDVIHCAGWITAVLTAYLRYIYRNDPAFSQAKVVYSIYDNDLTAPLGDRTAEKLRQAGLPAACLKSFKGREVGYDDLTRLAIGCSDAVVVRTAAAPQELLDYIRMQGKPLLVSTGDEVDAAQMAEFYRSL